MSPARRAVMLVFGAVLLVAGLGLLYWEIEEAGWVFRRMIVAGVALAFGGGWLLWEAAAGRHLD